MTQFNPLLMSVSSEPNDRALVEAVYNQYPLSEIRRLLHAGADPDALFQDPSDPSHCSLLHLAVTHKRVDILELLIAWGANVESTDEDGRTPLHRAAKAAQIDAMHALIDANANIHARDQYHSTPLHCAATHPNMNGAALLLQYGADAYAQNTGNKTPFDWARSRGNYDAFEQTLRSVHPIPQLTINAGEKISKRKLFSKNEDGKCLLDHPDTWHRMWEHLESPLTKEDLLGTNQEGRTWLARGIECQQFKRMITHLEQQGEILGANIWITGRKPTDALQAAEQKEVVSGIFKSPLVDQLSTEEVRRVYKALSPDGQTQVANYHQLLANRAKRIFRKSHEVEDNVVVLS